MSFSAAQKTLMYELLGLFQGATFDWFDYNDWTTGLITSVPIHQQLDFSTATTRMNAIIAAIEAGSDGRESRIGAVLTEYGNVSLDTGRAHGEFEYNPAEQRALLRNLLETHLGIRVRQTVMGGSGRSVQITR
jgi:hypothetical protein